MIRDDDVRTTRTEAHGGTGFACEVGTTGRAGGDSSHTVLILEDLFGTVWFADIAVSSAETNPHLTPEVLDSMQLTGNRLTLHFHGDMETDNLIGALEWAAQELRARWGPPLHQPD